MSDPTYDRELIARMLEDYSNWAGPLTPAAVAEQIEALRAADNADSAGVRTVNTTGAVRAQAWAKLEREWAIDGMPADKIRLARAAFDSGAALAQQPAPPSAPVGVEGLPQPFGYVEPRHDLSGYEVFDEPGPRRAAIWNMHGMRKALAQTRAHYSIDADPYGIRERVADAITGALSFGAQGAHKPPAGHWLEPFWDMARAEREAPSPPTVGEAAARRLDDYLGGEFDIRIGKQAAHAALVHALAQQPETPAQVEGGEVATVVHGEGGPGSVRFRMCAGFGWHMLPHGAKLYTTPQPAIPEGMVLVPKEPTQAMWDAATKRVKENTVVIDAGPAKGSTLMRDPIAHTWYAMIAASSTQEPDHG